MVTDFGEEDDVGESTQSEGAKVEIGLIGVMMGSQTWIASEAIDQCLHRIDKSKGSLDARLGEVVARRFLEVRLEACRPEGSLHALVARLRRRCFRPAKYSSSTSPETGDSMPSRMRLRKRCVSLSRRINSRTYSLLDW